MSPGNKGILQGICLAFAAIGFYKTFGKMLTGVLLVTLILFFGRRLNRETYFQLGFAAVACSMGWVTHNSMVIHSHYTEETNVITGALVGAGIYFVLYKIRKSKTKTNQSIETG